MNYTLDDFKKVLLLKNNLILMSTEELVKMYQDYDLCVEFLEAILILKKSDDNFLLLDDQLIDKIDSIIKIYRFNTDTRVNDIINQIIAYLNTINNYSFNSKKSLIVLYFENHEKLRNSLFCDKESLLCSLAYDATSYISLLNGNLDSIEHDDLFLSSLNYFIETVPEFFGDKKICEEAKEKISSIAKKKGIVNRNVRRYSRQTLNNFQNLKK